MPYKNKSDYGDSYNYNQNRNYEDIYSNSKPKRNKRKFVNLIIFVLSTILAVSGSIMVYGYSMLDNVNFENDDQNPGSSIDISLDEDLSLYSGTLLNDPMVLNVLLFGSDSYSVGDGGRTDTILMVSIDNRHKKLKLTSFLRDIWIQIPGYGSDRLNAAYALGGPALAVETIERNFGVEVDRYVVADFVGFEKIVNTLGGVDMYLTEDECYYLNTHCDDPNKLYGEGVHHLSGLQALNHARNRDSIGSDFDRTTRQRDVISAIVSQVKSASLPQITSIISECGPLITTNFKKSEIASLIPNSLSYLNYPMDEFRLPEQDNFSNIVVNGAQVLGVNDMDRARYDLARFIFEDSIRDTEKTQEYSILYDQMMEEKNTQD